MTASMGAEVAGTGAAEAGLAEAAMADTGAAAADAAAAIAASPLMPGVVEAGTPVNAPSLTWALVRIVLVVAVIAAAGYGWLYWQRRLRDVGRRLEVIDRAFLARGASVALLRADDRRLLVGVSAEGVRLLRDLDAGRRGAVVEGRFGAPGVAEAPPEPRRFPSLLSEIRRREDDA